MTEERWHDKHAISATTPQRATTLPYLLPGGRTHPTALITNAYHDFCGVSLPSFGVCEGSSTDLDAPGGLGGTPPGLASSPGARRPGFLLFEPQPPGAGRR